MATQVTKTPLFKQYEEMKRKHPDAVLLFRAGDFYETFSEDAVIAAEILGLTLVRRANGSKGYIELAGFPHHALDTYLPKLVRAGKRVAICEQLEDPRLKTTVKRGISELITPGKAEPKPEAPITDAVEAVKNAAADMSVWDNPKSKFVQLTFDFDL